MVKKLDQHGYCPSAPFIHQSSDRHFTDVFVDNVHLVPESATSLLLGIGLAGLAARGRRRRRCNR